MPTPRLSGGMEISSFARFTSLKRSVRIFHEPDHIALGPVIERLVGTYLGIVFTFIHMFFSTPLGDQEYSSSAVKVYSWDTI